MTIEQDRARARARAKAKAAAAGAPAAEEPGFFDNLRTSLSALGDPMQGLQAADDMARIGVDTLSRGMLDKFLGPEEQAKTKAARERAGWAGTVGDVAVSARTSPGMGGGFGKAFGTGGLDAMLSEYGHQPNWIPEGEDLANIAKAGGLGGFASGAGNMFGGLLSRFTGGGKTKPLAQSEEELFEAAQKAKRNTRVGKDTVARADKLEKVRAMDAKGPSGWAEESRNLDIYGRGNTPWSRPEAELIYKLGNPRDSTAVKALNATGSVAQGGDSGVGRAATAWATGGKGPILGAAVKSGASVLRDKGQQKTVDELKRLIVQAEKGAPIDPEVVAQARNALAQLGSGSVKSARSD